MTWSCNQVMRCKTVCSSIQFESQRLSNTKRKLVGYKSWNNAMLAKYESDKSHSKVTQKLFPVLNYDGALKWDLMRQWLVHLGSNDIFSNDVQVISQSLDVWQVSRCLSTILTSHQDVHSLHKLSVTLVKRQVWQSSSWLNIKIFRS